MAINLDPFVAPNEITSAIDTLISQINATTNPVAAYITKTDTATATLTAANITAARDSLFVLMTGATAGSTLTLDTVANVVAALQQIVGPNVNLAGYSMWVRIINHGGGNTWTVTTATGWTLTGTQTVATGTWRDFVLVLDSATAGRFQSVGKGTED